jgi:hypothetical protein
MRGSGIYAEKGQRYGTMTLPNASDEGRANLSNPRR